MSPQERHFRGQVLVGFEFCSGGVVAAATSMMLMMKIQAEYNEMDNNNNNLRRNFHFFLFSVVLFFWIELLRAFNDYRMTIGSSSSIQGRSIQLKVGRLRFCNRLLLFIKASDVNANLEEEAYLEKEEVRSTGLMAHTIEANLA